MEVTMNFIDKLERKYGRFGIPNLMKYVIGVNILGTFLGVLGYAGGFNFYYEYLSLDIYQILHGQVWRLITFVLYPSGLSGSGLMSSLLWFAIWVFVYYSIGNALEHYWGTFRFTLFYLSGVFFVILTAFIFYFVNALIYPSEVMRIISYYAEAGITLEYLNQSLFLAFALANPNAQFLIYFVIPVKAKWLSILYFAMDAYFIISGIMNQEYITVALIVGSLVNLGLFFLFSRGKPGMKGMYKQHKRKTEFRQKMSHAEQTGPIHRCAICGRTELDAPHLDFRYCSKCEGNYEYCSEHLFTHEHVHR